MPVNEQSNAVSRANPIQSEQKELIRVEPGAPKSRPQILGAAVAAQASRHLEGIGQLRAHTSPCIKLIQGSMVATHRVPTSRLVKPSISGSARAEMRVKLSSMSWS